MRSEDDRKDAPKNGSKGKPSNSKDKSVGNALRAVYQEAVSEAVPDEMLDLLKKLG